MRDCTCGLMCFWAEEDARETLSEGGCLHKWLLGMQVRHAHPSLFHLLLALSVSLFPYECCGIPTEVIGKQAIITESLCIPGLTVFDETGFT